MSSKYCRHFLKTKEAKSVLSEASERLKVSFNQIFEGKVDMELIETDFAEIFLINGRPLLAKIDEKIFPTLVFNEAFALTPKIVVDMGAVPHVCNGANVMAPGVIKFEGEFKKGDFVIIADKKHDKIIAVGEAFYDYNTAKKIMKGIVVRNVHFVGDRLWNFIKKLKNI